MAINARCGWRTEPGGRRQCMPVLDPPRVFFERRCAQMRLCRDAIVVHCGNGWLLLRMEICRTLRRVPRGELSKRRTLPRSSDWSPRQDVCADWEQLGMSVLACAPPCLNLVGHDRETTAPDDSPPEAGGFWRERVTEIQTHRPRRETRVAVRLFGNPVEPVPVI